MKASEVTEPGFYWWLPEVGHPWRIVQASTTFRDPSVLEFWHIGWDAPDTAAELSGVLIPIDKPPSGGA